MGKALVSVEIGSSPEPERGGKPKKTAVAKPAAAPVKRAPSPAKSSSSSSSKSRSPSKSSSSSSNKKKQKRRSSNFTSLRRDAKHRKKARKHRTAGAQAAIKILEKLELQDASGGFF